jgi:hypothetical protein
MTLVIYPRPQLPEFRIFVLIVIILIMSRIMPDLAVPFGMGSWVGWLMAKPTGHPRA